VRAVENDVLISGAFVINRDTVNTIFYTYDGDGQLIRKRIVNSEGAEFVYNFTHSEDGNVTSSFRVGEQNVVSHSRNDSFGRKIFDELQLGRGFLSRQFAYHEGDYTDSHVENSRLRSSPVTELVSMITLTGGRTIGYEYDAEDRITKVSDSVDGVTTYEYDALGQLVSENGARITYDNFGNILSKNGATYRYETQWRDRLMTFGGRLITYDQNGNPVNYLGTPVTWEKGRQLRSFGDVQFTYNDCLQ